MTMYIYIYIKGGLSWVGKMCCKAPGGKCAKSISKSRKRKSRKVERCMFEFLPDAFPAEQAQAKSTKLKPLRVERDAEKLKS